MDEIAEGRAAVLAVDDTPANLLALEAVIGSQGYEFVGAASGYEALERVTEREFAVILLDVMMPGLTGVETLERIRALPVAVNTPVIFLTAHDPEPQVLRRAYDLGALDYLVKPIEPDILRGKLSSFIALYRQGQEIRRQSAQLQLKDRYIAVLAHDLRNPLATILFGVTQLLRHDDDQVRKVAERIKRSTARMVNLTDDLLESARAAAAVHSQRVATNLSELCRDLLDEFETTYPDVRFASAVEPSVVGDWDPARLTQALSNLLVNGVKYGSGWVSLQLSASAHTVSLTVENSGQPIPAAQLERIFDPFVQAEQGRAGVGLGLFIVREIAHAHGGEVQALSNDKRTRFVLRVPFFSSAD